MQEYQYDFIEYAIQCGVLRFGEFKLNSGRVSPYFFNTGLFNTGAKLARFGCFYAQAVTNSQIKPDVLYGPAYKGIPLVSATAIALSETFGVDIPFAFNRKEIKDHGEGGSLVGAPLNGSVLILDDVVTAGNSVRESVDIICKAGATASGVLIALDRQEPGQNKVSATAEIRTQFNISVLSVVTLMDVITFLADNQRYSSELKAIRRYWSQFGMQPNDT